MSLNILLSALEILFVGGLHLEGSLAGVWDSSVERKEEQGEALPAPKDSPLWFRVNRGQRESFSGFQGALDQAQGASLSHDRIKTHAHFYE